MLLDGFGVQKRRIAEFQLCDLECAAFDMKFLDVAFTIRIRDDRVFKRPLHSARGEQFLDGFDGLVHGRAGFRERSIEERKLATNGIGEGRIRKPRNIVKVDWDSRRFLDMISHQDAGELGLKVVTHFGEEPALDEFVGSDLQIITADLSARDQASYGDDLSFGKVFFAVDVNFTQWGTDRLRRLRRCTEYGQRRKNKCDKTRSKIANHSFYVSGNRAGYST